MNYDCSNLKLYRKQNGYTQEQIAERLGVSRQAVAKWEKGETIPDIENVIALADMYEVSIDSLVRNLAAASDKPAGKKHIFGVAKVNSKGQITLPKKCRDIFGIKEGSMLLLLGDEDRGIAIIKM